MTANKRKSMTELRGLAQSMGVKWAFGDDRLALEQKISLKQVDMLPKPSLPVVSMPEDQRLRTKPPAKVSDEETITAMLAPYITLGLKFTVSDNKQDFSMSFAGKTDSGTMRQPPRIILECARRLMA